MKLRMGLLMGLLGLTTACGSSYSPPSSPTPPDGGGGTPVSIVRGASTLTTTAYAPGSITVNTGTTISWKNDDTVAHTSTGDDGSWNSGTIASGATFSRTFSNAGRFTYHCTIHPGMVGTVNVQ